MSAASRPQRTLVVELDGSGHRFSYVRVVVDAALERGDAVTVLTKDHSHTREHLDVHLGHLLAQVELRVHQDPGWPDVENVATEIGAATTVIPDADGYLPTLLRRRGWRGPGELSLLVMRTQVPRVAGLRRWAWRSAAKAVTISALMVLPRITVHVLRSPLWRGRSPWRPAYDPIGLSSSPTDVARLRTDWDLEPSRYWYGVLGALSPNKNLPVVVDAVCQVAATEKVGLLVAGRMWEAVAADLPELRGRLDHAGVESRIFDRILDDVELDAAVTAIDCLLLAYGHNGPSGMLGKALAAGTRVVAAGSTVLREDCRAAPHAATWCRLDTETLADALRRARTAGTPDPLELSGESEFGSKLLGDAS